MKASRKVRKLTSKLLVYVDGRCMGDYMEGSFAAYYVPPKGSWRCSSILDSYQHLNLKLARHPVAHKMKFRIDAVDGENPTSDLSEARALVEALKWVKGFLSGHRYIETVEMCMDSRLTVQLLHGKGNIDDANMRLALSDIWLNLWPIKARVLWSLIPGALMKKTVIGH